MQGNADEMPERERESQGRRQEEGKHLTEAHLQLKFMASIL